MADKISILNGTNKVPDEHISVSSVKQHEGDLTPANIGPNGVAELDLSGNVASPVEGADIKSTGETGGTKFLGEDGDGTSSWKAVTATDADAIHDNVANEIQAIATSLTPADTDVLIAEDADAGTAWSKAKLSMLNLYNYIKAKTDLLYAGITHASTHSNGGSDEISVENLGSGGASARQILQDDGDGSVSWRETVPSGTAYPSTPRAGEYFFRTDLGLLMRYDGTNWVSEYDTTVLYIFTDYSATTFTGGVYSIGTYTRFKLDDAKKGLDSNFNDFKILFQVNGFGDGSTGDCALYDESGSAIVTGSELDFSTDTWQGTRKDVDVSSLISDGTQYAIAARNGLRLSKASIIVSGRRKD